MDYLLGIVNEVERKKTKPLVEPIASSNTQNIPLHNHTLKTYAANDPLVSLHFPEDVYDSLHEVKELSPPSPSIPTYGCLKHGKLPTYREYKQRQLTQKQYGSSFHTQSHQQPVYHIPQIHVQPHIQSQPQQPPPIDEFTARTFGIEQVIQPSSTPSIPDKSFSHISQPKRKAKKQRKIMRRTFKIGKSSTHPRVSVLLSNRTLRKQVNQRKSDIQNTPMSDIRAFLIKRGLVKVGTVAPNNVLRKMYEDAMLTCGEVYNHNSDILVYNFFHSKE